MTDEQFKQAKELKTAIALKSAELEKAKSAFAGLSLQNQAARTHVRVVVPSNVMHSFNVDPFIFPEAELILEYIKRLETYISQLQSELLIL